jgi:3-keto-5-aminohexanoate cleavage enzyme
VTKLVITAAICGAELTRAECPDLPISPAELIEAAYRCREAGASIVHLHVRDREGRPTQDPAVFAEVIAGVRDRTDLIVQISTGGAIGTPARDRAAPLDLRPDMATLTTGTVNFGDGVFLNPPETIEYLATRMRELGVKPEVEIFDAGMIDNALRLVKRGLLTPPLHFDLVMGVPGGIGGRARDLFYLVEGLPAGSTWSVAGIGRLELPLATMALVMDGHVRVGFEDNIYYAKGVPARSNEELVARIVRLARELGREVANPAEARSILGL